MTLVAASFQKESKPDGWDLSTTRKTVSALHQEGGMIVGEQAMVVGGAWRRPLTPSNALDTSSSRRLSPQPQQARPPRNKRKENERKAHLMSKNLPRYVP